MRSLLMPLLLTIAALSPELVLAQGRASSVDATSEQSLADEYRRAYEAAKRGEAGGLLTLLRIAEEGRSAEISEVAFEDLQCLLLQEPDAWLRALASTDLSRVERYIARGGLVFMMPPDCSTSSKEYERLIVVRLRKFKGDKREMALRDRVLQYFHDHPVPERD